MFQGFLTLIKQQECVTRLLTVVNFRGSKEVKNQDCKGNTAQRPRYECERFAARRPCRAWAFAFQHRVGALYASCLHIFRHLAQILLEIRQYYCVEFAQSAEKSDGAIRAQSLCGIALKIFIKIIK